MMRLLPLLGLLGCTPDPEPVPPTDQPAVHLLDRMPAAAVLTGGMPDQGEESVVHAMSGPVQLEVGGPPQIIDVPVTSGASYRVSSTVGTTQLVVGADSVGASLEIEELGASGQSLTYHNHLPRIRGTREGESLSALLVAGEETTILRLHLHPGGPEATGTASFSDVQVLSVPAIGRTLSARTWAGDARTRMIELHEDTRPALVLAGSSEVVFSHSVTGPATLRFALASAPGVAGEVCVAVSQDRTPLVDGCTDQAAWTELTTLVQDSAPLKFQVTGPAGSVGLLADPRVIPRGRRPGPNVVVITLDTLRADALSVYGAERPAPAVEAFAKKSVLYEHAFSVSGWTAPSLASMVSSTMPAEHGAGTRVPREVAQTRQSTSQNRKNQLNYRGMKTSGLTHMAEVFRAAGYQTVGFYTNYFFSEALGFAKGFGRYHRFKGGGWAGGKPGVKLMRAWLDERKEEGPFFMSLHFVDPHTPYHLRKAVTPDLWPHHPDAPDIKLREKKGIARFTRFQPKTRKLFSHVMPFYESEVAYLDQILADVFKTLDGLENTVVIVTSDHGEAFKEHGLLIHGNTLYQELVHIPLLLKLPDGRQAGTRVDTAVSIMDVAPTVVGLAGLEVPQGWQGVDLLTPESGRTLLMESVYSGADQFAAVRWPHKLIWRPAERHVGFAVKKRAQLKLFDLAEDPAEKRNLRKKKPKIKARLKRALDAHVEQTVGWHLRCTPGDEARTLTLESTGPIGQVADFSLESDDVSTLSGDGRTLTLTVGHNRDQDRQDWVALRSRQAGFVVSAEGVEVVAGPLVPDKGACALWENTLDADDLGDKVGAQGMEELRALGYVE